jgi:hypothetical protein
MASAAHVVCLFGDAVLVFLKVLPILVSGYDDHVDGIPRI